MNHTFYNNLSAKELVRYFSPETEREQLLIDVITEFCDVESRVELDLTLELVLVEDENEMLSQQISDTEDFAQEILDMEQTIGIILDMEEEEGRFDEGETLGEIFNLCRDVLNKE